jgi:hypothetical protein
MSSFPDTPSKEPVSDLLAQFMDALDPKTKRTGVLVSHDNIPGLSAALRHVPVVPVETGVLVMSSPNKAAEAHFALQSGVHPQAVIGKATGAGSGKAADQTAVVQGHTPAGAVVSESMVRPDEVPAKIEDVRRDGKIPHVTSPEAAIGRRMNMLIAERLRN